MSSFASRSAQATVLLSFLVFTTTVPSMAEAPAKPATTAAGCAGPATQSRTAKAKKAAAANSQPVQSAADKPNVDVGKNGAVSKTSINNDALQSSNTQNTYDAIKNVPGVASADTRGGATTADSLQIRGIKLSSTTSYRLDGGLPIVNNISLPIEDKCAVEALKGAGALEFGVASPAGIINYVFKRATDVPTASVGFSTSEYGAAITSLDLGRRFGTHNQFGVRTNLATGEFGSFVQNGGGRRYLESISADYHPGNGASVDFDFERFAIDVTEQASILQDKAVNNKVPLPKVPDPTNLLSGTWAQSIGIGENASLKATLPLSSSFALVAEGGRSDGDRPMRNLTQIGNYNVTTGQGTESVTLIRDQITTNKYLNFELKNHAEQGAFSNDFAIGVNRNERDFNNPGTTTVSYAQNLYNPIVLAAPANPTGTIKEYPNDSNDLDYFFTEGANYDRYHVYGGVRQINYRANDVLKTGGASNLTSAFLAPAAAVVYDLTPHITAYASYLKSLEETGQAPVNSANAYTVLPPTPSTQREVGIRAAEHNVSAVLGYFEIDRGNATINDVTNIYALNGTITYQGLESTFSAKLNPYWALNAGAQLMRATEHSPTDPTINNKVPENTPNLGYNVGLAYNPAFVHGLTLRGGMLFVGQREINPSDQGTIPPVTTYSAGANYGTFIDGHHVSFNLNVANLTDVRYFSAAVTGALGVGAPRTVTFSVRFDGN